MTEEKKCTCGNKIERPPCPVCEKCRQAMSRQNQFLNASFNKMLAKRKKK